MKSLQQLRSISLAILLCMVAVLSCFLFLGRIYPKALVAKEFGKPIITHDIVNHNYLGINQIISSEDTIYIMHANYGVISVYDSTGSYQYTISVYSHENGRVKIAFDNGLLCVCDKQGNLYRFQKDKLHDVIPRNQASTLLKHIDFEEKSSEYFIKGASIYRKIENRVSECIISRPSWLIFTQASIAQPLLIICMLAFFACLILPFKKS